MMVQTSTIKKVVYLIIIFVVGFFIYSYFFKGMSAPEQLLKTEKPLLTQNNVKGKELLKVLLSLKSMKLDDSIFSSNLFTNLQDFTIVLPDAGNVGRVNPFAVIGRDIPQAFPINVPVPNR